MTKLLLSTAIAGVLVFAGAAYAQGDDHHRPDGGHPPAGHEQGPPPAPHPAAAPDHRAHVDNRPGAGRQAAPAAQPAPPAAMRAQGPNNAMRGPAPNNAMRGPAPGNAMRGPGNAPHRDYSSYHRNFTAPHHFRAPTPYRRPSGWYAHRWTYGQILPALFWTQDYWLNDFSDFGLMPPPPGTVWVRDGNDALLIDQYSGEIIQVDYGVFY